jgi:hypothetical protein
MYAAKAAAMLKKRHDWLRKLEDPVPLALANRRWSEAKAKAEERIKTGRVIKGGVEQAMTQDDESELSCQVLVGTRKGYGKDRWLVINKVVKKLREQFATSNISLRVRLRAQYESGMLAFQLRRFAEARQRLRDSFSSKLPVTLINRAQAEVALFEEIRRMRSYSLTELDRIASRLRRIVKRVDLRSNDDSLTSGDVKSLSSFRIDARCHLARVLAFSSELFDAKTQFEQRKLRSDKASSVLSDAKEIRGEIVEPSMFTTMMLAEAEVAKSKGNYVDAVKAIGRVGFKLCTTGHKDFEHLETVFDLLFQIPRTRVDSLDGERHKLRGLQRRFRMYLNTLEQVKLTNL